MYLGSKLATPQGLLIMMKNIKKLFSLKRGWWGGALSAAAFREMALSYLAS